MDAMRWRRDKLEETRLLNLLRSLWLFQVPDYFESIQLFAWHVFKSVKGEENN